jgi:hypothetical protein
MVIIITVYIVVVHHPFPLNYIALGTSAAFHLAKTKFTGRVELKFGFQMGRILIYNFRRNYKKRQSLTLAKLNEVCLR